MVVGKRIWVTNRRSFPREENDPLIPPARVARTRPASWQAGWQAGRHTLDQPPLFRC